MSLRTRTKDKALSLSRLLSVRIDKLALQFFDKPEHIGAAMKLLHQQAKAWDEYGNLPDVEEHFYTHVHDHPIDDQEQFLDKILETIHSSIPESENPTLTTLFDLWVSENSIQAASKIHTNLLLTCLPSIATRAWLNKSSFRHSPTNSAQTLRIALPLCRRKFAMVLKPGVKRPGNHISSILRPVSRSSRRVDWIRLRYP